MKSLKRRQLCFQKLLLKETRRCSHHTPALPCDGPVSPLTRMLVLVSVLGFRGAGDQLQPTLHLQHSLLSYIETGPPFSVSAISLDPLGFDGRHEAPLTGPSLPLWDSLWVSGCESRSRLGYGGTLSVIPLVQASLQGLTEPPSRTLGKSTVAVEALLGMWEEGTCEVPVCSSLRAGFIGSLPGLEAGHPGSCRRATQPFVMLFTSV